MMMNQSMSGRKPAATVSSRTFYRAPGALFPQGVLLAGGPAVSPASRSASSLAGHHDSLSLCTRLARAGYLSSWRPGSLSNMGLADHLKPKGRGGPALFGDPIDLAKSFSPNHHHHISLSHPLVTLLRFVASPHVPRSPPPPALQRPCPRTQAREHLRASSLSLSPPPSLVSSLFSVLGLLSSGCSCFLGIYIRHRVVWGSSSFLILHHYRRAVPGP